MKFTKKIHPIAGVARPDFSVVANNLKLILLTLLLGLSSNLFAQKVEPERIEDIGLKYSGNITAPDFPKDIEWLNLVLIDPKGKIIGSSTGEGVYDLFDPLISGLITEYDKQGGILNRDEIKFALEKDKAPKTLLSFPGKIAADATTSRLFITDS